MFCRKLVFCQIVRDFSAKIAELKVPVVKTKLRIPCLPSPNHTRVLVPVPMAQEHEAVTTLLRVFGTDTKTNNKQEVVPNFVSLNFILVAHFSEMCAIFTNSAQLGRVGHRVAMSVCLSVCLRH